MALTLEIISRQRTQLGDKSRIRFEGHGGNIGRSVECEWILPDPERFVSSRHAAIDFRSGSYYIVDTSTNGVYVNDADTPVGKGNPQRLFDGDRLRMGEFLMIVRLDDDEGLGLEADLEAPDPVNRRHRVEAPATTANTMVDEHLITGAIDVLSLEPSIVEDPVRAAFRPGTTQPVGTRNSGGQRTASSADVGSAAGTQRDSAASQRARLSVVQGGATTAPARTGDRVQTPPSSASSSDSKARADDSKARASDSKARADNGKARADNGTARAAGDRARENANSGRDGEPADAVAIFMRAAGLSPDALPAPALESLMHRLGQLTREVVVGLNETLHDRAQQKTAMRLANTTIQPRQNNPLKFSASVDEALARLLRDEAPEYMSPVEAMREAFADIKRHQAATLQATQRAFEDFVDRLEPAELEQRFERGQRRKALLPGSGKARYWDLYADLYQALTQHAPGQFPQIFTEEFARAYDEAQQQLGQQRERA